MIESVADLAKEIADAEREILNKHHIKDTYTIGQMFEGLTSEILEGVVFKDLNLRVSRNGFIKGSNVEYDVLLVEGEGSEIPRTGRFEYDPAQILCVIQVKKNLYADGLESGYENIRKIIDNYEGSKLSAKGARWVSENFTKICRRSLKGKSFEDLSLQEQQIYKVLEADTILPPRIIWGYNGFVDEKNFRDSFIDYLEAQQTVQTESPKEGFGPHNFPNLIICGGLCAIKSTGLPFIGPIDESGSWPFFNTSSYNPLKFLLEIIWTKLTLRFDELSMDIFGKDLLVEPMNRFLEARAVEKDELLGWNYTYRNFTREALMLPADPIIWEPALINTIQHTVLSQLCSNGEIDLVNDSDLEVFILSEYDSLQAFLTGLCDTGLVFIEDNKLRLLTDQCQCVFLPDGRIVAGENRSGRLDKWIEQERAKT